MRWGVLDQTIQELEDQLFSKILLSQRQYNAIRPPSPKLTQSARELTDQLQVQRGCDFPLPSLFSGAGHGPLAELIDGSVKFDLIGGIGPYFLGHSHPLQIRAALQTARGSILNSTNFIPAQVASKTNAALLDAAHPSKLSHCWLTNSGSMANDCAMRLIWQKRGPRNRLLAFDQSFAGRSIGMQSITKGEPQAAIFNIDYIPFPNDATNSSKALEQLQLLMSKYPDQYAAFHGELIQGEAGINLPEPSGIEKLFKVLQKAAIPIWIDEVQTFARSREIFAFQQFNLSQYIDLCTVGKALNISCVIYTDAFKQGQGLGGTFQAPIASLIFAHDLLRLLKQGNMLGENGRLARLENDIRTMFEGVAQVNPLKKCHFSIRGIGTMWALSFAQEDQNLISRLIQDLYQNGIILWRAGRRNHCLRMLFPVTITNDHLDQIQSIFVATLKQATYLEP